MNNLSPRISFLLAATAAICSVAASQAQMHATSVSMSTTPRTSGSTNSPGSMSRDGMPSKLISAHVRNGILTIDGMVANVELNYEIQRSGYMYFFVPGVGTAVVSLSPIADSERVKDGLHGETLSFVAGGHTFELSSEGNLLPRERSKSDVYVRLDRSAVAVGRRPRMGFGDTSESPYDWPLSAPSQGDRTAHVVTPPPMPVSVLPRMENTASMSR